jgi:hypothetical protein
MVEINRQISPLETRKTDLIQFFHFNNEYKELLYYLITRSSKNRSRLFNFITIIKLWLNFKLYFKIRQFQDDNFVEMNCSVDERISFI